MTDAERKKRINKVNSYLLALRGISVEMANEVDWHDVIAQLADNYTGEKYRLESEANRA